jgi:hypothetical protein
MIAAGDHVSATWAPLAVILHAPLTMSTNDQGGFDTEAGNLFGSEACLVRGR